MRRNDSKMLGSEGRQLKLGSDGAWKLVRKRNDGIAGTLVCSGIQKCGRSEVGNRKRGCVTSWNPHIGIGNV